MGDGRTVFMTGFPGFISRRLLQAMLADDEGLRAVCLVEPRFELEAREQARRMSVDGDGEDARVEVVVGDISRPALALSPEKVDELGRRVTDVLHLAAIYDLAVGPDAARRVNVWGTRHVVELCRKLGGLRRLVHFSTCYVSGDHTGTFREDELDVGQGFKNHYESTKFDAECIVRQAAGEMPTVVLRPSIVVGDSRTGETQKFDGPYFGMIFIDKMSRLHLPLPYLGPSRAEVNVVPVDFVIDATLALLSDDEAIGGTYALADPDPLVARDLYAEIVRGLGALGPVGTVPVEVLEGALSLSPMRRAFGVPREVLDYFNHEVNFDASRATEVLSRHGVSCPAVRSYLPTLIDFFIRNRDVPELRREPR